MFLIIDYEKQERLRSSFLLVENHLIIGKRKKKMLCYLILERNKIPDSMFEFESSSGCIGLKCAWNGISKQNTNKTNSNQSILEEQSILLSGLYGDDVAFIKQSDNYW